MKIFTVRHGQTDWNPIGRIQGHTDRPLNDVGVDQAHQLGLRLANETVDIIYTSDLQRAAKTAEAINAHHNVELIRTPELREINFGIYEGRIYSEIAHEMNHHHSLRQPFPGGDCIFENFRKMHAYLDKIVAGLHQNIIIVGHFGTVRAAICYFLQIPTEERDRFHIDNTAVHCFERGTDGKFVMTLENDTSHLSSWHSNHQD